MENFLHGAIYMIIIFLRQRTTDKVMSQVFDKLIRKETIAKKLPTSYMEGLERVCREDKYAFVTLDNMAALLQQKVNCKLEPLDVITPTTIAMTLQRNSPYRGIINAQWVSSFISVN